MADEGGVLAGDPLEHLRELAGLVHLPDLLGAADPASADEDLGEGKGPALERGLQIAAEGGVQGHVALVDGDAKAAEDGADGAAIVEGATDATERGTVEDDLGALVRAVGGEAARGGLRDRGTARVVMVGEGSEEGEGFLGGGGGFVGGIGHEGGAGGGGGGCGRSCFPVTSFSRFLVVGCSWCGDDRTKFIVHGFTYQSSHKSTIITFALININIRCMALRLIRLPK